MYFQELKVRYKSTKLSDISEEINHLLYSSILVADHKVEVVRSGEDKYTLKIRTDTHPSDPREDSDCWLGTMLCAHRGYNLGDKQPSDDPLDDIIAILRDECGVDLEDEIDEIEDDENLSLDECNSKVRELVDAAFNEHVIAHHLYLYDHSCITIRMSPFSCPWDSGCVGIIYVPRKKALEELSLKEEDFPITRKVWVNWLRGPSKYIEQQFDTLDAYVEHIFKQEVEVYDSYLRGDVWGFELVRDYDGEVEDSCWGFYGNDWQANGLAEHLDVSREQLSNIVVYGYGGEELEELTYEEVFGE